MLRLAVLLAVAAVVSSSVIPSRPDRRVAVNEGRKNNSHLPLPFFAQHITTLAEAAFLASSLHEASSREATKADAESLKRYKQVLDLLVGVGANYHYTNEFSDWDVSANFGLWTDEKYPREFLNTHHKHHLPRDTIFAITNPRIRAQGIQLFDFLYFTKDFDTFIRAASWARAHVNPGMFTWAYTLAVYHRRDTNTFVLPPWYEIVPNFFVPTDVLHTVYRERMTGVKEGRYRYNSTGYEYHPHGAQFGGVFGEGNRDHGEYRISYFREDPGLNNFFSDWFHVNPSWMDPGKYGLTWTQRRGENFYYMLQQIYARYQLERLNTGLTFSRQYVWRETIKVGYNPRVRYFNGKSMYVRPDFFNVYTHNVGAVLHAESIENRYWDTLDAGRLKTNGSIEFDEQDGSELLGRLVYGTSDRPHSTYYSSLYYTGLDTLAYAVNTGSDRFYVGTALSTPLTALRDPLFYEWASELVMMFQYQKSLTGSYRHEDLLFNGVTVQDVEVERLLTFFDYFDYEVTNGVPMLKNNDYTDHRYEVRTYRLNHKPYRYNITVNSEKAGDAMVRVFLGPKYDSDDHLLNLEQARVAYFELDRFQVQLTAGVNVLERSSKESPIFVEDQEGFRNLYTGINNAINQKGEFYISEAGHCGFPERLQLPMGWKGGRAHVFSVVITPFDASQAGSSLGADIACGGTRLYDKRPLGFPFDRPLAEDAFDNVPNVFFKDVFIHHRDEHELNRPSA